MCKTRRWLGTSLRSKKEAKDASADNALWGRTVQGGHDAEKNELMRKRREAQENQLRVQLQMDENKQIRADRRREHIEAASSHSFPLFAETFISETEVEAYRKALKVKWRQELDQQALVNKTLRNMREQEHHEHAVAKHHENMNTMGQNRGEEASRKLLQGKALVSAWERDIRLKSIKAAIHSGKDVSSHASKEMGQFRRPGASSSNFSPP